MKNSHRLLMSVLAIAIAPLAPSLTLGGPGCELFPPLEVAGPGSPEPLRFNDVQTLVWEDGAASCSSSFKLYRGDAGSLTDGYFALCFEDAVPSNTATDPEEPLAGQATAHVVELIP